MTCKIRILGFAPKGVFSGFEKTFFNAIEKQGAVVNSISVELPIFKLICTLKTISAKRSKWGLKRDLAYNTSIKAFKKKSEFAQFKTSEFINDFDVIYQIGALWNPVPPSCTKPFVLSVDYTNILSDRRNSNWKLKQGNQKDFWLKEEMELFLRADLICATTMNAKISIVEDYSIPEKKVVVVGPGVSSPFDMLEPNRKPAYDSYKILFVGKGSSAGKGLDVLLEAFSKVKKIIPNAELIVVGPRDLISGDGIRYLGRVSNKQFLKDLFYEASIFVMPSIFEPVGQVFLEAMSCKLPCIGTTLDAMPELISDGLTGYTIEPGNVDELFSNLSYLLANPEKAAIMGAAGFNKLRNEFTWDVVGAKIYSNIKLLLDR